MARLESGTDRRGRIDAIVRKFNTLPDLDNRTADEILGYDENGAFGNGR